MSTNGVWVAEYVSGLLDGVSESENIQNIQAKYGRRVVVW